MKWAQNIQIKSATEVSKGCLKNLCSNWVQTLLCAKTKKKEEKMV